MATRLKSGSYRTQVFVGYNEKGKRKYKSFTAKTAKAADYMALEWQAKHPNVKASDKTLADAIEVYIIDKSNLLSPSTLRSYRTMQRMLIGKHSTVMRKNVFSVDSRDCQRIINSLAADVSPKTVRNYYGLLKTALKQNGVTVECSLPQKVKPKYNIPDEETIGRLFEGAKGTNLEIPILLAAVGPMRRGEIAGATIDDLDGDVLHVHRCVVISSDGERIKEYPKTYESDRKIVLPHEVAEKIREQGYIYNGSLNNISKQFPKLLQSLGIPRFRFHDLRHAFVSIAHAAGLPDKSIQDRGGWSTPYTMNAVYKHTLNADNLRAQEAVNNVFSNLMQHDMQHDIKKSG